MSIKYWHCVMLVHDTSGVLICRSVHNLTGYAAKFTANTCIHTKHNDLGSHTHIQPPHALAPTRPTHSSTRPHPPTHTSPPPTYARTFSYTAVIWRNSCSSPNILLQLLNSAEHISSKARSAVELVALLCYQDGTRVIFNRSTLWVPLISPQYVLANGRCTL